MINLMYLVLTAMLALNISSEILNAFKTINDSIGKSNKNIVGNNGELYSSLDALAQQKDQAARVAPYNEKAKQIHKKADEIVAYLESLQKNLVVGAGDINKETGHIEKEGDIDLATTMFVEGEPNSKKGGDDLKAKLMDFRNFALSLVKPEAKNVLDSSILLNVSNPVKTENNPNGDWATGNFYHMPVIAAVTLFSKYINDVRNSEAMVVRELMSEADAGVLKFDAIQAIATVNNSYVRMGQKVEADIVLAAYSRSVNPTVSGGAGGQMSPAKEGVAHWEAIANSVGQHEVSGTMSLPFNGIVQSKPWKFTYTVGSFGGALQLDKMNVFYIGLDNPVSISAAGYNMEDADLSIPGAVVTKTSMGHYSVRVTQPGKVTGVVTGRSAEGTKELARLDVRVKFIPDPETQVAGKHGGVVAANVFRAQQGIVADLKDFLFDGVRYDVVSYSWSMKRKKDIDVIPPITVSSFYFKDNKQVYDMQQAVRAGDRVFLDDIRAKGPDGRIRNLGSISFSII